MPPSPQQPPPPYGQQPAHGPQPPYGQPPAGPGPYGSPYPQAQPYPQQQPPYVQPPYAQQPYPGQQSSPHPQPYPAWGAPFPAAPPRKRRVGLVLGIVGGVVTLVVVGLVLLGAVVGGGFPAARNKLTLPGTLVLPQGNYRLDRDLSASEGRKIEDEADGAWDAKDTHGVVGSYDLDGDAARGALALSGMYGRFKNPDAARRDMMKGAAGTDGATLAVAPKDFELDGVTITCEVVTQEQTGTRVTVPMCAWADGNTGATVAEVAAERLAQNPSDVDLAGLARTTRQIRAEAVKPIG